MLLTRRHRASLRATLTAGALLAACALRTLAVAAPVTIAVDATEAPRKIFHAHLVVPASPGPLTLFYPKWIPGEHGPTGPITDLAGLRFQAGGKPLAWARDPVDMYAFHCDLPQGADAVQVDLDYLSPAPEEGFSGGASATEELAILSWNQLLLYPKGVDPANLSYAASLRLPQGWKYGTALPVSRDSGGLVEFSAVSLETLIDSPVLAGAHFRTIPLSTDEPGCEIDIAADGEAALDMRPEQIESYKQLVTEAGTLFGARHYRHYRFLLTLSDHTAHFGLEHHESSDDRVGERALLDPNRGKLMTGLLPHEYVHSWNGKYRRPAGLATPDYQEPMQGELLWVYEGLTSYLGYVLTGRCGLLAPEESREGLALDAADMDHRVGREWRPLQDTAVAAQLLYGAAPQWAYWRRGTDFYREGLLVWLEADARIRQQTHGARSLDDFCRRFHGAPSGAPMVKTYTFDDIVATLNDVAPYDWRGFLRTRLEATGEHAPLGGVEACGWKLGYGDSLPSLLRARETVDEVVDLSCSVGLRLKEDGTILDVVPGLAAAKAGVGPGMKVVAVDGRKFKRRVAREAIRAARSAPAPLDLLVENGEYFKHFAVDYHGGERYPRLERDASRPDLLEAILKPAAAVASRNGRVRNK
jgi:predicted metalloprotease with PDZ domain